jgi:FkbM family methyltransferase
MKKVYFQIGTNDGNDLFRDMVKDDKPDIVILVEPNTSLIDNIKKNYNNIENVYIYNNAIYYNNDEEVELVIPAKNGIYNTTAENGIRYSHGHFSLIPMNDWGNKDDMVKIKSKSITFDKICSEHNITNIDYLQIDTEGFDSEIINMIDLSKYKIKTIRFENWRFSTDCFTRYNKEKSIELGENGMKKCKSKLIKHNYEITNILDKMGNDYLAVLKD